MIFFLASKDITILGDPGAVSRVGKGQGRKFASTGKRAPGYGLSPNYFQKFKQMQMQIGHKKCFVLLCPMGEQFLLSSTDRQEQEVLKFAWPEFDFAHARYQWTLKKISNSIKQRKFYNEMWDK